MGAICLQYNANSLEIYFVQSWSHVDDISYKHFHQYRHETKTRNNTMDSYDIRISEAIFLSIFLELKCFVGRHF